MSDMTRRGFLGLVGAATAGTALAACGGSGSSGGAGGSGDAVTWWDHFSPLEKLQRRTFEKFETSSTGVPVEYRLIQTAKMGQALQLAHQSHQLPDVHSNAGLQIPLAELIASGWLQPMDLGSTLDRFPPGAIVDGVTRFDGKIYSFPIFSPRQYVAPVWFNSEMLMKADLDPENPPKTYDEFRAACGALKAKVGGQAYPWIWNLAMPPRMATEVGFMAQAAGFEGNALDGVDAGLEFRTGEYRFDHDAFLTVIEFLLSLKKDGYLFPGSSSLVDKTASVRWAAGSAAFFFDGPWRAGAVQKDSKQFLSKLGVGPMLVPEDGTPVSAYRGAMGGAFYLNKGSKHADKANDLLTYLTKPDYFSGLAESMDQPPFFLDAVNKAKNVHPAYRKLLGWFKESCFLAPQAVVANGDVSAVEAQQKPVSPGLGDIVQGLFSGQVKDARAALRKLSDQTTKAREDAIAAAEKKKGVKVSMDDWKFANWQPRKDYTEQMYKAR